MKQAVPKIEAHFMDKWHQKKDSDEPDRIFSKADDRRDMVGIDP